MEVQNLSRNYIYMSLLRATCFDFCEKPSSGKQKYTKEED